MGRINTDRTGEKRPMAVNMPIILLWLAALAIVPGSLAGPQGPKPRAEWKETGSIHALLFSPDGKLLAVSVADGPLDLWEVPAGKRRARLQEPAMPIPESHAFSRDGATLVSGMGDGD